LENQIIFRPNQSVKSSDFSNMESYIQQSFDDIVYDGIDPGQKYSGLAVSMTGPTQITIAPGRYYSGGQVFVVANATVISVQANLPVATNKIGTVIAWGVSQEQSIESRAILINADTKQFSPQEVTTESSRLAQLSVVYGAESGAPTRGVIGSSVIAIADVFMNNAGIVSITMDPTTQLSSVADVQEEVGAITIWQAQVGQQINTLSSDLAKVKASIPPDLSAAVAAIAAQLLQIWNILAKPSGPFWSAVDRFINIGDTNTSHAGYSAKVEDGLRFPGTATAVQTAITLLNPIDPKVITVGNITLPAYTPVVRYSLVPPNANWASRAYVLISSFPVVSRSFVRRHLSRHVVRYGDYCVSPISPAGNAHGVALTNLCGKSVVANQSSAPGLAEIARRPDMDYYKCQRGGGEPYTPNWASFWAKLNVAKLSAERPNVCWHDHYDDPYWDAIIETGSHTGSAFAQSWLNQSNGWMTHANIWLRDVAGSGDLTIQVVEVDSTLRPDHTKVMASAVVPVANLVAGAAGNQIAITPAYLQGGTHYALIVHTPGNHSFYIVGSVELAEYGYPSGCFFYYDTTQVWLLSSAPQALFMQVLMAQFTLNRYEVAMASPALSGGISAMRVTAAAQVPQGTSLSWEVQNGGIWYPLNSNTPGAFAGSPSLVPLRAVFTGTSDLMPGIDLTQAENEVTLTATSLTHWSDGRSLGSATSSVKIDYYVNGWDAAHHTLDVRLETGGVTSGAAGTITTTPDPTDPTQVKIEFVFTPSAITAYDIKTIVTTTTGYGFPIPTERWDFAF
jgi:hypothetical protein